MKKKNIVYKSFLMFLMFLPVLFTGCNSFFNNDIEADDSATFSITLGDSDNRNIKPVYDFENFTNFRLTGTVEGSSESLDLSWATYDELAQVNQSIKPGNWTFTLTAKDGDENFSGIRTATISKGSSVQLSFVLSHVQSSTTGSLSVSLTYPANANIVAAVYKITDGVTFQTVETGTLTDDDLVNNKVVFSKTNLPAGKYSLTVRFYYDYNENSPNQGQKGSYYEIFEIESGLTTVVNDTIQYFMERGFASAKANSVQVSEYGSVGIMEFRVNVPMGTQNVSLYRKYGDSEDEITSKGISYSNQNRDSVIEFYDYYDLTAGTEYEYKVRYDWQWNANYEATVRLTAAANGVRSPSLNSYPNFSHANNETANLTLTSAPNITFYVGENEHLDNGNNNVVLELEYRDENDPGNYNDGKHIYVQYEYKNNRISFARDNFAILAGQTRTLCAARLKIKSGNIDRYFQLHDWNSKAVTDGVPETISFPSQSKDYYIHFPITIPSGTKSVRIERCMAPAGTGAVWEHIGGQNFDSPLIENRTETFYDYYAVNNSYYFYSVKFYDSSNTCSYYSFDETNPVAEGYSDFGYPCNFTGFSRPSFTTNPVITYTKNDDAGTFTITLTQAPTINWNGLGDNNTWWTIDYQYGNYFNWFNSNTSNWAKTGNLSALSTGSNSLNLFYFYYSTGDFFNSYRYFTASEITAMGIPQTIEGPVTSGQTEPEPVSNEIIFTATNAGVNGVKLTLGNLPSATSFVLIRENSVTRFNLDGSDINNSSFDVYDFFVTPGVNYVYTAEVYNTAKEEIDSKEISITPSNGYENYSLNVQNVPSGSDYVWLKNNQLPFTVNYEIRNWHVDRGVSSGNGDVVYNYTIYPQGQQTQPLEVKDYYLNNAIPYIYKPDFNVIFSGLGIYYPRVSTTTVNYSGTSHSLQIKNPGAITRGSDGNLNTPFEIEWYSTNGEGVEYAVVTLYYENSSRQMVSLNFAFTEENAFSTNFNSGLFGSGDWSLKGYRVLEYLNGYSFTAEFDQAIANSFTGIANISIN